jgi:hypothetical protein
MYTEFMSMLISTHNLINSSEARKNFAQLMQEVSADEEKYFVILENGKVKALLVNPHWIEKGLAGEFPVLKSLRVDWTRNQDLVEEALETLQNTPKNKVPKLLR